MALLTVFTIRELRNAVERRRLEEPRAPRVSYVGTLAK
jgi:hypothetical protein